MKITVNDIEVRDDQIKAVYTVISSLEKDYSRGYHGIDDNNIQKYIVDSMVNHLTEKLILERGPKIMDEISNNQIINAVIMKVAGNLSGK